MTPTTCSCRWNYGIPAVVGVCAFHASALTHTPRDGYTIPCPTCSDEEGETAVVGSGSVRGEGCKGCVGSGRAMVTLEAAKAAIEWREKFLPEYQRTAAHPLSSLLSGRVGRASRRRR